ncbi:MAG: glycosyltransferase [bacterium]
MRVALVHHWLVTWRGGERVLAEMARLYPDAPVFTLFGSTEEMPPPLSSHSSHASILDPGRRFREALLPLYPLGVRSLDLRDYDLVLSSDASVVKGVRTRPDAIHLCYCHAPPRYAWDFSREYVEAQIPSMLRPLAYAGLRWIRHYDAKAAQAVDAFATNSDAVRMRIQRHYGREARVIAPPVELSRFTPAAETPREDFYLCVGQMVPYKRADIAVDACVASGRKLVVVGEGPMLEELRGRARGGVQVIGGQPDEVLVDLYRRCRALIFPGEEDFGIVPLEAMACGTPVVALGAGGALESVVGAPAGSPPPPAATGCFFSELNAADLVAALDHFEARAPLDPADSVARAQQFSPESFRESFLDWVTAETRRVRAG